MFKKENIENLIKIMDNEIDKFQIEKNIVVYRTFDYRDLLKAQRRNEIKKGDTIIEKGFMGTSLVKEKLLKEHSSYDTIMKIYIPDSSSAIYLDFISNRRNEQELLFKRNTILKVLYNRKSILKNKREMVCILA